ASRLPRAQITKGAARSEEAAQAVYAAARSRRRRAKVDAAPRGPVTRREDAPHRHRACVHVAADEVAVVRLELARAERAARDDLVAEARRVALHLRLDRLGHVPVAAVRDVAVRPRGVPPGRRTRTVPQARLREQDERAGGAGGALWRGALPPPPAGVQGRRERATLVAPGDRSLQRPVELERTRPVADGAAHEARRGVTQDEVRFRDLLDRRRGTDLAAEPPQSRSERVRESLRAAAGKGPADRVCEREQDNSDPEARRPLDRLPRVRAAAGEECASVARRPPAPRELDAVVERMCKRGRRMDPPPVEITEDGRARGERMDRRADVVPEAGQRQLLRPHPAADP